MKRYYNQYLLEYLNKKMIIISGPRQCGKTTVSKQLNDSYQYLNFDDDEHRKIILEKSWDRKNSLIIFDELHKKPKWKSWLKGIFDTEGLSPKIIVTGSAKLDTYKKVGDSMAGRYFQYRLHPFDVKEYLVQNSDMTARQVNDVILRFSGFPEPFLEANEKFYNKWKKTHLDIILRQDLISQEDVKNLKSIELLIDLLRARVGSPISYSNLANDLQVSDKTVKRWLDILENMYIIFKVLPYSKNIARSNLKRPKYYFYDIPRVHDEGARIENLVACSLLKQCNFSEDCLGIDLELFYLSKKGGHEIDFAIVRAGKLCNAIEVKTSDDNPDKSFHTFAKDLVGVSKAQLVYNIKREKTFPDGLEIRDLSLWLANFN